MKTGVKKGRVPLPKTAMILAAGFGTRMQPLTHDRPKAMVELLGKPLIGHMLDWLDPLGLDRIVINLHFQPAALKNYLSRHPLRKKISFSDETRRILDTGGGVKKALEHLGTKPFFVANCDSFFDPSRPNPFITLTEIYRGKGALLLLALTEKAHGYKGRGDFECKKGTLLQRPAGKTTAPFVFTGLQILDPALFEGIREDVFSLNRVYDRTIRDGLLEGAVTPTPWYHIGTPETLTEVETLFRARGKK